MVRNSTPLSKTSVRALILSSDGGSICLIRREKSLEPGQPPSLYYVCPGGGVESNETEPQALRREVREETGLSVEAASHLGTIFFNNTHQQYWVCHYLFGSFRDANGVEHTREWQERNGLYRPEWVPLSELKDYPLISPFLQRLLLTFPEQGWPRKKFQIFEDERHSRRVS